MAESPKTPTSGMWKKPKTALGAIPSIWAIRTLSIVVVRRHHVLLTEKDRQLIGRIRMTSDIAMDIFGDIGGHAASNETAYIQASFPEHIHSERYSEEMTMTTDPAWSASPVPYTISLYNEGEGYPTFDQAQADLFFARVNTRVAELVNDIVARWERAGVN